MLRLYWLSGSIVLSGVQAIPYHRVKISAQFDHFSPFYSQFSVSDVKIRGINFRRKKHNFHSASTISININIYTTAFNRTLYKPSSSTANNVTSPSSSISSCILVCCVSVKGGGGVSVAICCCSSLIVVSCSCKRFL